jgi:hypothetical protein
MLRDKFIKKKKIQGQKRRLLQHERIPHDTKHFEIRDFGDKYTFFLNCLNKNFKK